METTEVIDAAETLAQQVGQQARSDPRGWARRILERHANGDRTVHLIALDMARKALPHWSRQQPATQQEGRVDGEGAMHNPAVSGSGEGQPQ